MTQPMSASKLCPPPHPSIPLLLGARDHWSAPHARGTRAASCAQPILLALLHSPPQPLTPLSLHLLPLITRAGLLLPFTALHWPSIAVLYLAAISKPLITFSRVRPNAIWLFQHSAIQSSDGHIWALLATLTHLKMKT